MHGRNRKEHRNDRRKHYAGLEATVDQKALENFQKPAYQSVSVSEYIADKYGKTNIRLPK